MESLKNKWQSLPLRRFFILTLLFSVGLVVLFSALIIGGCVSFRHWLLPDSDAVYLTIEETLEDDTVTTGIYRLEYGDDLSSLPMLTFEQNGVEVKEEVQERRYSIQKIENSFETLSPKRKLAYRLCGITMVAAPAMLAFCGIILCSVYFYRRKLKQPLDLLSDATNRIVEQNLDFEISYNCGDEMGTLCCSFEKMRKALYENNREMWEMLEERRILQASVAHDLRNPIAIIEGYTEYLDKGLKNGEMSREKTCHIVQNLNMAAKRLEQYTESVRLLNQSEETVLNRKSVSASGLVHSITEDLKLLAEQKGILLQVTENLPNREMQVDSAMLYRILENILSNALRYAKEKIHMDFSFSESFLSVTVTDDGEGFSVELLKKREKMLFTPSEGGHMGIGLAVSRLLCKKHGGSLELSNTSNGACVKIHLAV